MESLAGKASGTARRLGFGFGALVVFLALASSSALSGLAEVQQGLEQARAREQGVRAALELASAVRDQYAHQAHTIIIGDASHLHFYEEAHAQVLALVRRVAAGAAGPEETGWVADIERASNDLDALFRGRIVPAVLAGQTVRVREDHAEGLMLVGEIQERTDRLVRRHEEGIDAFAAHAADVQRRTFAWSLVLLVGATGFAAGVGVWIFRSVARPVALLGAGAARIAAGDLEARIALGTPDEFGRLAQQFDAMTAALKEHQERLLQSERLAVVGRLAAGVAHEINNPLGVILGYVKLLEKKAPSEALADLAVIEDETQRAREIVRGLLDLARPERMAGERVDLREVCDEVAARLEESRAGSGVSLRIEGRADATGDPRRLRQEVLNLVKNALEAAGPGGSVTLRARVEGGEAVLDVCDSGAGVPASDQARIFEPFFTTKTGGTGLGLAVSRAIVQAHGGSISLASAPGGGAVATVRLPAAKET